MKLQPFTRDRFTATEFDTVDDKAKFANHLADFILSGFPQSKFPKWFYTRLSSTFGHIAHFNQGGFFATWFAYPANQSSFIHHLITYRPCGSPDFTYSDVEREVQKWLSQQVVKEKVQRVLAGNLEKQQSAELVEENRLNALAGCNRQEFKVLAASSNTGAFGHRQYVVVARDGSTYKIQVVPCNRSFIVGQVLNVPLENGEPTWDGFNVECPDRVANCPADELAKIWA